MIVTICKSCDTINMAITDRCRWCGSESIVVKNIDPGVIDYKSKNRPVLGKPKRIKFYSKDEF